jgi:hypothetical protein
MRKRKAAAEAFHNTEKKRQKRDQENRDPRPEVELPGSRNRLVSDFAAEIASTLANNGFFAKEGIIVQPDVKRAVLAITSARAFRTEIENYFRPTKFTLSFDNVQKFNRTISIEDAASLLECRKLIDSLPAVRAVNDTRLPVLRSDGTVALLPEGYDSQSQIFTLPGSAQPDSRGSQTSYRLLAAQENGPSNRDVLCRWLSSVKSATR